MAQQITKAVVPAAGLGTRLLPSTKSQPKEMLPVGRKPIIQYVVEELQAAGLQQILIITGERKRAIEDHLDADPDLVLALEQAGNEAVLEDLAYLEGKAWFLFTRQSTPKGLGHAVSLAADFVGSDDFAVALGDSLIYRFIGRFQMTEAKADIGLIGLAVMGQNLALNMDDHGYTVAVYNRTVSKVDDFISGNAKGTKVIGTHSIEELVGVLKKPRRVMLMIKAGKPVDDFIELLIPHLEAGDIIIDGGNSNYNDTIRRTEYVESKGLLYIGTGVSGGEEGARHGPSIMPGGSPEAWPHVKNILQGIAAKVEDGTPCCDWVGENGAGHYVKMTHNGIEYGDMQLISESYYLMKHLLEMSNEEMHRVFAEWNRGKLDSYLIEITRDILGFKEEGGEYVIDHILDTAGQKGTGKWTAISALEMGIPLTLITEAVLARFLSALLEDRKAASKVLTGPDFTFEGDRDALIKDLHDALYASKIMSYTQGYMLMRSAAAEYGWNLNYGGIALMWRGGCIIRSVFLGKIKEAFDKNPDLTNLLLDDYFKAEVEAAQPGWRQVVAAAVEAGIPVPAMSSALAFYDGYRRERVSANMIQAQRDYFGAHTYERVDRPRGEFFHTDWIGSGGDVISGTYVA